MPKEKTPRSRTSKPAKAKTAGNNGTQERKSFPGVPPIDLESQIRQRAYELFQERGCTPGQENDDWLTAEREVLARSNSPSA